MDQISKGLRGREYILGYVCFYKRNIHLEKPGLRCS